MSCRVLVAVLAALAHTTTAIGNFNNGGTPPNIPADVDCAMRAFAWESGQKLMPRRGEFKTLWEALQLWACDVPEPSAEDGWVPPTVKIDDAAAVFVDPVAGEDDNSGAKAAPLRTLAKAIAVARAQSLHTIALRAGVHRIPSTLRLSTSDSSLTIVNYSGEHAVLSGGEELVLPKSAWEPYQPSFPRTWVARTNQNNVFGRAAARADTRLAYYLGQADSLEQCQEAADNSDKGEFTAVTWHHPDIASKDFAGGCYGAKNGMWNPVAEDGIDSAFLRGGESVKNAFVADLSGLEGGPPDAFDSLRIGDQRAIRAKFPNGDPELSGESYYSEDQAMGTGVYAQGWVEQPANSDWLPHRTPSMEHQEIVVTADDWPSVNWPMHHPGGDDTWTGEGDWGEFHAGLGGTCEDVTPPFGYWCASKPPRGILTHYSPSGLVWGPHLPRGSNYTHPEDAVVVGWRGGGRWFTWIWKVQDWDAANGTATFVPGTGNQGGEGADVAQQWYIENVLEELDSPREWFYDHRGGKLYFVFNDTQGPTGDEVWTIVRSKVLFNITGSQANPVKDVSLVGLELRDTALTWLDPHGLPSGGDWALQRSGAVLSEGTESLTIDSCLFTKVDGNGVFLSGYNRNASITNNEFSWIGSTAIGSWGFTGECLNENCTWKLPWGVGPDGRKGNQPQGTRIFNNLFRELGIFQKQASAYFHAKSGKVEFAGNVAFNGPRAMVNINDGFMGGDEVHANLLLNAVRESGDHSAVNSWDRMPYIHDEGSGPTIIPLTRREHHNWILGTYSTQEAFDTDDGSSYYHMSSNFLVYGANGLKSDFGGHHHASTEDVFAFVDICFGNGNFLTFANNTCVLAPRVESGYASDCHLAAGMVVRNNTVASETGNPRACGTSLSAWVAAGHDAGTTATKWPSNDDLVALGKRTLFEDDTWDGGVDTQPPHLGGNRRTKRPSAMALVPSV